MFCLLRVDCTQCKEDRTAERYDSNSLRSGKRRGMGGEKKQEERIRKIKRWEKKIKIESQTEKPKMSLSVFYNVNDTEAKTEEKQSANVYLCSKNCFND